MDAATTTTMDKKRDLESDAPEEHETKKTRLELALEAHDGLGLRLRDLLSNLSERDQKLVTRMLELSCCGRCILRLLGFKEYALYELPDAKIRELLKAVMTPNAVLSSSYELVCTLCVGSVQCAEDFAKTVVERLQQAGYTSKTFNMNVTVPTSTLIRQHAFRLDLVDHLAGASGDKKEGEKKELGLETTEESEVTKEKKNAEEEDKERQQKEKAEQKKSVYGLLADRTVDIKEIFKLVMSWQVAHLSGVELDFASPLKVQVTLKHSETGDDHIFLSKLPESGMKIMMKREKKKQIRVGDGRANIVAAISKVSDERFKENTAVPPLVVKTRPEVEAIDFMHESVYIGGRYLKFSRDVSQTPWVIGKTKLTELSVSETIAEPVKKVFQADDYKFVTAGREDANVRMLGSGRPFYIELVNPRRGVETVPEEMYTTLMTQINNVIPDKVQVRKLTWIPVEATKIIKEGEETKTKSYSALCWVSQPVTQALLERINTYAKQHQPLVVDQQTPIRVLQRRAQMIRKKTIYSLKAFALDKHGQAKTTNENEEQNGEGSQVADDGAEADDGMGHFLVVHLHTEAGTYIKEFVHGDLGRNMPNLGTIAGCEADIMELDVMNVDLEFPPPKK